MNEFEDRPSPTRQRQSSCIVVSLFVRQENWSEYIRRETGIVVTDPDGARQCNAFALTRAKVHLQVYYFHLTL